MCVCVSVCVFVCLIVFKLGLYYMSSFAIKMSAPNTKNRM